MFFSAYMNEDNLAYAHINDTSFWSIYKEHMKYGNSTEKAKGYGFIFTFLFTLGGTLTLIVLDLVQLIFNYTKYFKSIENILEALMITSLLVEIILIFYDKDSALQFGIWSVFLGKSDI